MKTKATTIILNILKQGRGLCLWTMAALAFFILGNVGRAQTTNVIYIDNFARSGLLNGTTPDTVDTGDAVWVATTNAETSGTPGGIDDQALNTDGAEVALTNTPNGSGPFFPNGYLPFTPQVGNKYILTVSVWGVSGGNEWLAAGYSLSDPTNAYWGNSTSGGAGWFLVRATLSSDFDYQCFLGPGTGSGSGNKTGGLSSTITNVFQVVLDTTTGTATKGWTVSYYCNGTLGYSAVYGSNPNIHYVGIGADDAEGLFLHFSLTNIAYPNVLPTISEQPQNAAVSVGQTATFWVNASGVPAPTYQWVTNAVGSTVTNAIVGATNAVYVTPPTTPAYNNLNYSAQVINFVGTNTSAPGTLTVQNTPATVFSAMKATAGITNALTNVVVTFSKPVSPTTALNAANYTLNNGATVTSVSNYGSASNSVVLTTSILSTNDSYSLTVEDVQDFYGDTMTNITVPVLPAGLAIYLTADSGIVTDNSGNVCEWLDQTTNGNNAVQNILGGAAARPTPAPAAINGEPAITFNANNGNFLTAATSSSLTFTNNGITIYDVVNFADFNANREMVSKSVGDVASPYDYYANTSGNEVLVRGYEQNDASFISTGAASSGVPVVVAVTGSTNNGTVTHYLDGVPNGSGTLDSPTGIGDVGNPLYVGGRSDLEQFMNGQMAAVMIFNTALSAQDMTNVDNYLGEKYFQLTITTNLSASTISSNGFAATYTIDANQGSAHLIYQWQVNGTNIPGATGDSYTTPVLGPANSNTTYDVVITLPNGTTYTSVTNTLTVLPSPPYVTSAGIPLWEAANPTNIVVLFNETVSPATATVATNYTLNNGASVLSAAIGDEPNKVILTTTAPLAAWNANPGYYSLTVQNVQDSYGDTIVTASPSVGLYPPNTALWIKANTGVVTDSGANTVNTWNDLSGNGNALTQDFGPPYEPLLITNVLGDAAIEFAATNYTYMSTGLNPPALGITGDMSIFSVVDFATLAGGTNGFIVGKTGSAASGDANQPAPYDYYDNGGSVLLYRGNGDGTYANVGSTSGPSVGFPYVLDVVMQGTNVTQRMDGNPNGTHTLSTTIADAGQSLFIGTRGDGVVRLTGGISELIVVGQAVDSNDVVSIENYLAESYTLPTGTNTYLAITQEPVASTNVPANSTLTVPAAASGTPAAAIQWFDTNNIAQPGQTNGTLTINNDQVSDGYYLVATNVYGAVTSSVVDVSIIPTNPTNIVFSVTNNQLYLSWPADHIGWQLQAQSNSLSVGISTNWVNVTGTIGTNQVIIPVNPANGSVFYRLMLP